MPSAFWTWLDETLLPTLYAGDHYNGQPASWRQRLFTSNQDSFRVGPTRIRQQRINHSGCSFMYCVMSVINSNHLLTAILSESKLFKVRCLRIVAMVMTHVRGWIYVQLAINLSVNLGLLRTVNASDPHPQVPDMHLEVLLLSYAHVLDACESQGPLRGTATKCNQQYSIKNEDTNDYYPPNWLSSRGNDTVGHGQAEAAFLYHSHQQLEGMSVLGHLGWYSGGGYTGTYIHLGWLLDLLVSPASWFLVRGYTRICSNICVDSVELIVFRETYSIGMHSNVMLRGRSYLLLWRIAFRKDTSTMPPSILSICL